MRERSSPRYRILLVLLFAVVSAMAYAQKQVDIETHLRVRNATRAYEPVITGEHILFSYQPNHPVRHVAIAFSHESYAITHHLERNAHGVFIFLYRPPAGTEMVIYRYVVDGLWMVDPMNLSIVTDEKETKLSEFRFPAAFPATPTSPTVSPDGTVELYLTGAAGMRVYVTGDFANWDPFVYRLAETNPGTYRFSLPLPPGRHWYQYVIDGLYVIDPLNPKTATRDDGRRVSVVTVD